MCYVDNGQSNAQSQIMNESKCIIHIRNKAKNDEVQEFTGTSWKVLFT